MSITLTKYPPDLSLVKNPAVFKMQSNNFVATPGIYEIFKLIFTDWMDDGEAFTLNWGDETVTITAKNSPDDSGNQIPAYVAGTLAAWVLQTREYLNANYLLNRYFSFSSTSGDNIILTARESGTAFILTLTNHFAGITEDETDQGEDEVLQDFFGIIFQTWVKRNSAMVKLAEDLLAIDASGYAITSVSEIIKAEFEGWYEFEFPEADANSFIQRTHLLLPFYVRYAEHYGNPPAVQKLTTATWFYALNGGVPPWKQSEIYEAYDSYWDRILALKNFLTWHPTSKKTDVLATEKLYFVAWDTHAQTYDIRLRVICYPYNDGATKDITLTQAMNYMDVWEIEVSYARLNTLIGIASNFNGGPGEYYTVEVIKLVTGVETALSEVRKYYLDYNEYQNEKNFLYRTSLGSYDTLRATGMNETSFSQDRTFINKTYLKEFELAFHIKRQGFVEDAEKVKCNSGWITEIDELDAWLDLINSDDVYEIIDGKIYPVIITSTDTPQYSSDPAPAYVVEFEYERTEHDTSYMVGDQSVVYSELSTPEVAP
jgi:hypothetical protein